MIKADHFLINTKNVIARNEAIADHANRYARDEIATLSLAMT